MLLVFVGLKSDAQVFYTYHIRILVCTKGRPLIVLIL